MSTHAPTGYALLRDSRLNKGTALSPNAANGLRGRLPPVTLSLELQVARLNNELAELDSDLQRYLLLCDLQVRNETLFYALLLGAPARFMPRSAARRRNRSPLSRHPASHDGRQAEAT
jgi:malate dehydrogenase (oxaloacetate-decarboxylating)(NADP+)